MTRWCTICDECDGTGERDWLEGGCCYACGGSGLEPLEDDDYGPADMDFWETFYDGVDLSDRRAFRGEQIKSSGSQDEQNHNQETPRDVL